MNSREPTHILLVSHKSPCGATWLLNALLAVGIQIFRNSSPGNQTFVANSDGSHSLHPAEMQLKAHFPALSENEKFFFDDDILVEWTHDFPSERKEMPGKIFIFVRDPRDSLYSYYKRRNALVDFETFLEGIDYKNGLNQIDSYAHFTRSWLAVPDIRIFRFEDFKLRPVEALQEFLSWLGASEKSEAELRKGIQSSSIESAKTSERNFSSPEFHSWGQLNRAGIPNEWKQNSVARNAYLKIEQRIGELMMQLGYSSDSAPSHMAQAETAGSSPECDSQDTQARRENKLSILREMLQTKNYGHYQDFELDLIRALIDALSTSVPDSDKRTH